MINLGITTTVLVLAFIAIYFISTQSAHNRPMPNFDDAMFHADGMEQMLNASIEDEKRAAAQDLLILLIVTGIFVDIIVALVSYYLAEEAIKPVKQSYESQKVFIANASHEIKTPLAAISANLEALNMDNNRWINNIATETSKLVALDNQLLTLAKSDRIERQKITEVDLKVEIEKILSSFESRLDKYSVEMVGETKNKIKLNASDLMQILNILVDNAAKYAKSKIKIGVSPQGIDIANDGAKIRPSEIEHIFERFYQADKSSEGVGLGLAIAKNLADRNDWELLAESDRNMTKFTLKFAKSVI